MYHGQLQVNGKAVRKNKATATRNESREIKKKTRLSAHRRKFVAQAEFNEKLHASAKTFFKDGPGSLQRVSGLEKYLGLHNKKCHKRMEDLQRYTVRPQTCYATWI